MSDNIYDNIESTTEDVHTDAQENVDAQKDADIEEATDLKEGTEKTTIHNDKSEFETELENYLPTPENTDKLKKPVPTWVYSGLMSALVCVVILTIYSFFVIPNIKPSAVISYSEGTTSAQGHSDTTISDIAQKVSPSIVQISSVSAYRSFFGLSSQTSTGSGIILSPDGYILTSSSLIL